MSARLAMSDAPPPEPRSPAYQLSAGVFASATLAASAGLAYVVARPAYLPTNDGPQHVLSGYLQQHFADAGSTYQQALTPLPEFAERGFSTLYVPLLAVFGWADGLRVALSVLALAYAWAFVALACAVARGRTPVALLGFAIALPWSFYMGFLPFTLGASVGLGILAFWVGRDEVKRVHWLVIAGMLLVQAVMHVVSAAMTGVLLMVLAVARTPATGATRLGAAVRAALSGLPAMGVLAATLATHPPDPPGEAASWGWAPLREFLPALPHYVSPGPSWRGVLIASLMLAGFAVGVARWRREAADRDDRGLLLAGTLFAFVGLGAPFDWPGWQCVSPRFFLFAVPLGLALLARVPRPSPPRGHAITAAASALVALLLVASHGLHRRLTDGCAPSLAGLWSSTSLDGFTLPLPMSTFCGVSGDPAESEVPQLAPLFHVGALYAAARGGLTPYMFGGVPAVHAFRLRTDPEAIEHMPPRPPPRLYLALRTGEARRDPGTHDYLLARFAEYGAYYQHLLMVAATPEDVSLMERRGYVADWRGDGALIAHYRPCPLDVRVETDEPARSLVEVGVLPEGGPVFVIPAASSEATADGARIVRFPQAACASLWVRGYLDRDGSGSASKGDVFCEAANRRGNVEPAEDARGPRSLTCRLRRDPAP